MHVLTEPIERPPFVDHPEQLVMLKQRYKVVVPHTVQDHLQKETTLQDKKPQVG